MFVIPVHLLLPQTTRLWWNKIIITLLYLNVIQLQRVQGLQVGDEVCVEGFIMDQYCIDLGYLLDNPSVVTLENPGAHSLHCLLDVGVCRASNYVVLIDPGSSGSPSSTPTASFTPTSTPTTMLTTKKPTVAPTLRPTYSFEELFALLPRIVRPPTQVPTIAPSTNNDDFFSILKPSIERSPQWLRQPTRAPLDDTTTMNDVNLTSVLHHHSTNRTESLSGFVKASAAVDATTLYTAGYVVDDIGKDLLIQLGRTVGICSTCGTSGNLRAGLRAEIRGIITEVSTSLGPHQLAVSSVQLSNNLTSICQPSISSLMVLKNDVAPPSPTESPSYLRSPSK